MRVAVVACALVVVLVITAIFRAAAWVARSIR